MPVDVPARYAPRFVVPALRLEGCALLAFDVDGTLCESTFARSTGFLDPRSREFVVEVERWTRELREEHPRALDGAAAAVAELVAMHPSATRLVLTSRSVALRDPTQGFVRSSFPELGGPRVDWSFRPIEEDATRAPKLVVPPAASKRARLRDLRRRRYPGPMILVDDDEAMRAACRPGDVFLLVRP